MYDNLRCAECGETTDLAGTCPGMPYKWNERKGLVQSPGLDFTTYYRWEKKVESVIPTQKQEKGECESRILPTPVAQVMPSIVKVEIATDAVEINDLPQNAAGSVMFSINGTVISVAEDVSDHFLRKLVGAVKDGSC